MFSSYVDNLLSFSRRDVSQLIWDRFWTLRDYSFNMWGQTNKYFNQCGFMRLWCLWKRLRLVSYIQMKKKRHRRRSGQQATRTVSMTVDAAAWTPSTTDAYDIVDVNSLLLGQRSAKSQSKLDQNSSKILPYHKVQAWYNRHGVYQQCQCQNHCLKPFKITKFWKTWREWKNKKW